MTGMGDCTVLSTPWLILQLSHGIHHFASSFYLFALLGELVLVLSAFSGLNLRSLWLQGSIMLRERGKPRRGPSWYCYAARQKCLRDLERDLSIARTQQTKKPTMPPMAFVEEEFPEEPIQVPPESLLYTVLDAQDSPNTSIATTDTTTALEGATCIVQEEIPMMDRPTEPPLLNPDADCNQSPPSLFSPEQLDLIFEMRGLTLPSSPKLLCPQSKEFVSPCEISRDSGFVGKYLFVGSMGFVISFCEISWLPEPYSL
jgi:hypothetical protein